MGEVAIIGGSGLYETSALTARREETAHTPYGTVTLQRGVYQGEEIWFVARHGRGHALPPHRVPYRAHLWALMERGVRRILATAAVGGIRPDLGVGELVLVDQFLDFTRGREQTFYEGGAAGVLHVDMTEPYCPRLRRLLLEQAQREGIPLRASGTYVCTEGPRFETAAEIRAYGMLGGDVVGQTSVPEAVLARELGICYATVAVVANPAAGVGDRPLSQGEVLEAVAGAAPRLERLLLSTALLAPGGHCDTCRRKESPL